MEWINVADLRKDKAFLKMQKRLAKDWEEMKRRHQKMRESVQRHQARGREGRVIGRGRGDVIKWESDQINEIGGK